MWRYWILLIIILTSCASTAHADDVLIFVGRDSMLLSSFQLIINEDKPLITAVSPSDGTAVDRDGIDNIDSTVIPLVVTVPFSEPDGTSITFFASLANPNIVGQVNLTLGYNNSSGGIAVLYYEPNSTTYAGEWEWWGTSASLANSNNFSITVKGHIDTEFASDVNPVWLYFEDDMVNVVANVTSYGPETRADLNNNYSILVTSTLQNPSGDVDAKTESYTGPSWNATHILLDIGGVGTWRTSVTTTSPYWYDNTTNRTFVVYGLMNVTQNTTQPSTITNTDTAITTCRVQNRYTNVNVTSANVSFFINGVYLGANITNNTGFSTLTYQVNSTGTHTITCNVTDQAGILYYHGNAPEGNSTLTVTALPPTMQGVIDDGSDDTTPVNIGAYVTFTLNATDFQNYTWYLLICNGTAGTSNGLCDGNQLCVSGYVSSGTNATCTYNTSAISAWNQSWFGYACNSALACGALENSTAPFFVNHAPSNAPTLSPTNPTTTQNTTCNPNNSDGDQGSSVTNTYRWFRQAKSAGPYNLIVGASTGILNYSNYFSNDRIICESTPTDNFGLTGYSINTSIGTVQNGTVTATSNLITSTVLRTQTSSITGSCTIADGDTASMMLVLQDNRTGSYATTSTAPAAVYANASSSSFGSMNSTTTPTQAFTIYTQTAGNYSFRTQCQPSEGNPAQANSTPENLEVKIDTTPPVISDLTSTMITATSATITWTTNELADNTIDYGLSAANLSSSIVNPALVTIHSVALTLLSATTQYYYNATSCNADGYCMTQGPSSFTTLNASDVVAITTRGYCTGRLVENTTPAVNGVIKKGDVYEFWCELPNKVRPGNDVTLTVTNKNLQLQKKIDTPLAIGAGQVVLYP